MKRRLLWALLSWLSLLSFGAQAQTNVPLAQETFEADGEGVRYTSNTMGAGNANIYFERRIFTTPTGSSTSYLGSSGPVSNQQGSYAWTGERVRGNSAAGTGANAPNIRVPGYVQLTVPTTNYKNLRLVVSFADPHCSSCAGNTTGPLDRVRLRYSFDGSPFVTAGLLVSTQTNSSLAQPYAWGIDTSAPLDSVADVLLGQAYRDVTAPISGTGASLRIQVEVDANAPEITFDNIRVIGDADAGAKPALANLESTTLNYTEGQAPVQITNALTVGYSDNSATNITGGTLKISSGLTSGDQLNYTNQLGITGSYDSSTGVLTLTGTTSQANYQAALRTITFSNSNTATLPNGTRQLTFQLNNGSAQSNTPVRNLNVTAVLTAGTLPYTENFNSDGEGTRYFGNSFVRPANTFGFFRATTSPAYSGSDKIGDLTFTGWSGGYWYGEGTKVVNSATGVAVQLAPVNAAGTAGLKFVVAIGSSSTQGTGTSPAWDANDYFKLYYRANGGSWTEFGSFTVNATLNDGVIRRGGNADSVGVGTALRYFTFPLPPQAAVSSVDFQLLQLSDGDEELAFDNIRISAAVVPTVATLTPVTNITATSATLGGSVTSNGDGTLTERGVVYVVGTGTPTTSNTKALVSTSGVTTGTYSGTVSGLSPGTTYTVRAYAINEAGPGYGGPITFTTAAVAPTVTTATPTGVTSSSATLGGNVTSDGGDAVTERGVVYVAGAGTPTTSNTKALVATSGIVVGTPYSGTVSGLTAGTLYSVRAYAINSAGPGYGSTQQFVTTPNAPTVTAPANGSVLPTTTPTYMGTAQAGATVTVYVDGAPLSGTVTADGSGNWSKAQPSALSQGSHTVYATATINGSAASANSNTNTFTVDTVRPSVTITSTGNTNGGTTNTTPIPFTVTFSENVTGFVQGDVSVTNGSITGFTAVSGTTYSFNVTPPTPGTATTVGVAANVAQDAAGNGNTSGGAYTVTYNVPAVTVVSVTRLTPSPTATATVSYQVVFSSSVAGLTVGNFTTVNSGTTVTGSSVSSVTAVSGTTYTVVVNTGTGDGTLRLDVANSTGTTPAISNVPYTAGEVYTIIKSFAAAPTLRIQGAGSASGLGDVTAFVDVVQVLSGGATFANGLQNGSFENNNVPAGGFLYSTSAPPVVASPWSFSTQAGVSRNTSPFGSTAFSGDAVALLQSAGGNNSNVSQNLAVPTGSSYQVNFQTAQRTNNGASDQVVNVYLVQGANTVFVGSIQPNNGTYQAFTSASFSVTAPSLTATVSTTSASPTSTSPIPFSVSFTSGGTPQSVGTTFTASDVTVMGGTLNTASFSGSGSGPYTFTVTPPAAGGTVTVSLAANVANDANNTGNTASNSVSVQYVQPATATPVLTQPANGSFTNNTRPEYRGTSVPNAFIFIYRNGALSDTTIANGLGNFHKFSFDALTDGQYSVYVTATTSGQATSANSNTNTFTVDTTRPSVTITSSAGTSGSSTATTPIPFSVSFSESVNGSFVQGDLSVSGGTVTTGSFSGSGAGPYTFTVTPGGIGSTVSVNVQANVAQDAAGNFNTAAPAAYTLRYAPALTATVSTTSTSPTSTSPIPFSVSFSQSVGTSFVASDVTATNGTITTGSFSGSGAGPYTFTVTPTGTGTVTVRLAGNVAQDAATTGNTASNSVSVQFQAPTITVAPTNGTLSGTQGVFFSQTFTATGGSGTYTYSFSGTVPGLMFANGTLSGTPTASGMYNFTVTATDNSAAPGPYSGSQTYTLTIAAPAVTAVGWTGAVSTDWFTASNWSPAVVPTATIDVTIPNGTVRSPAITGNAQAAVTRNLTLNSGATLNMTANTLDVQGNLTNNGNFAATGGTVLMGTVFQSNGPNILGSGNTRFWNLTVQSNGLLLSTSASTSVQRVLTLNGALVTQSNPLTIESNSTGTGLVVNNGNSAIFGSVTVQRYISPDLNAGLGYRHFSTPVGLATVASLATGAFSPVVNPAYNTSATPTLVTPFPTVYGYDQSRLASVTNNLSAFDKGWFSPTSLSDALTVGLGYTVNLAANQSFSVTGPQNNAATGPISMSLTRNATASANTTDAGWQLVGNPFPSPLDYSQVTPADRTGLDAAIYISESTSQYVGTYRSYVNGMGNGDPILALGQGFFARVSTGQTSGTLNLRNSQRVTAYQNPAYHRPAETRPLVQLSLQGVGSSLSDDAYVYFENGATTSFDTQYDALKLPNTTGLNLSTSLADQQLSIDGQAVLGTAQRIVPLAVGVPAAGTYTLNAAQLLNLSAVPVYLRDKQLGTLTDLSAQPSYSFTITNAAALNTTRFELVFSPQQLLATVPASLAQQVSVYPNPAKPMASVTIELPTGLSKTATTADLLDALGRVVRTQVLPANSAIHSLPLGNLATGVYSLRLTTGVGVVVKKLVVE